MRSIGTISPSAVGTPWQAAPSTLAARDAGTRSCERSSVVNG
jgi:hypothetical protein